MAQTQEKNYIYFCSTYKSQFTIYIRVWAMLPLTHQQEILEKYVEHVYVQTVQIIQSKLAELAKEVCEDQLHHSCHWNPHSKVTGRYCEDCSLICRDQTNYLQFFQFAIGATLLLFSSEICLVPIVGLITDIVEHENEEVILHYLTILTFFILL